MLTKTLGTKSPYLTYNEVIEMVAQGYATCISDYVLKAVKEKLVRDKKAVDDKRNQMGSKTTPTAPPSTIMKVDSVNPSQHHPSGEQENLPVKYLLDDIHKKKVMAYYKGECISQLVKAAIILFSRK